MIVNTGKLYKYPGLKSAFLTSHGQNNSLAATNGAKKRLKNKRLIFINQFKMLKLKKTLPFQE
ncbi:hypothetical protein A5320_06250 [Rheinheimera sp. SA_1]|nr:hypothetical protein A5320_06250 [Rheinheimera sp. SA_1]